MLPVEKFFCIFQLRLNQILDEDQGVVIVDPRSEFATVGHDGSIVDVDRLSFVVYHGILKAQDIVFATVSALAEVGSLVWADWRHTDFRFGKEGREIKTACVSSDDGVERRVIVFVPSVKSFCNGYLSDCSSYGPPTPTYHDEGDEIRRGTGLVAKRFQ